MEPMMRTFHPMTIEKGKMLAALKKQKSSNEWHDLCVLLVGPTGAV